MHSWLNNNVVEETFRKKEDAGHGAEAETVSSEGSGQSSELVSNTVCTSAC